MYRMDFTRQFIVGFIHINFDLLYVLYTFTYYMYSL